MAVYQQTESRLEMTFNGEIELSDVRKDPTGAWDLLSASYTFSVPSSPNFDSYYVVPLPELPARANTSGGNSAPVISGYTLVDNITELANNKFYCDYRRAFLVFNSSNAGESLTVTASWLGSKFSAADINYLKAEVDSKANLNGDDSELFSVDTPTDNAHAVNKEYADDHYHPLNGSSTEYLDCDNLVATTSIKSPSYLDADDNQLLTSRQMAIANVDTSTVDSTYGTDEETVITDLRTKLNSVIATLRAHGLIET